MVSIFESLAMTVGEKLDDFALYLGISVTCPISFFFISVIIKNDLGLFISKSLAITYLSLVKNTIFLNFSPEISVEVFSTFSLN